MKITIHQPEHLPYCGFFQKVMKADKLIILDNVRFKKNNFQNRNRIVGVNGEQWITVPVHNNGELIKDIKIDQDQWRRFRKKNLKSIYHCYNRCDYFNEYFSDFMQIYAGDYEKLITLNTELLFYIFGKLGVKLVYDYASNLNVSGNKDDLLADICEKTGANTYLSGISGKDYIDPKKFKIEVEYLEFIHHIYRQKGLKEFVPNMSIIDALFNCSPYSLRKDLEI